MGLPDPRGCGFSAKEQPIDPVKGRTFRTAPQLIPLIFAPRVPIHAPPGTETHRLLDPTCVCPGTDERPSPHSGISALTGEAAGEIQEKLAPVLSPHYPSLTWLLALEASLQKSQVPGAKTWWFPPGARRLDSDSGPSDRKALAPCTILPQTTARAVGEGRPRMLGTCLVHG